MRASITVTVLIAISSFFFIAGGGANGEVFYAVEHPSHHGGHHEYRYHQHSEYDKQHGREEWSGHCDHDHYEERQVYFVPEAQETHHHVKIPHQSCECEERILVPVVHESKKGKIVSALVDVVRGGLKLAGSLAAGICAKCKKKTCDCEYSYA